MVPPIEPVPFFFGAARRSGTTWLAGMLNAHPQIVCRNEGWLFNELDASFPDWIDESRIREWGARREAKGTWLRQQTIDEVIRSMRRAMWMALVRGAVEREKWKDWPRLRFVGDKTTTYFCTNVDAIHGIFPDARFLHMLRDGRDIAVSDTFLLFRELDERDVPADVRRQAGESRQFHVFGKGSPVPLIQPAVMRHVVDDWSRCVAGARRARELFGAAFHEVRYERIVGDPGVELATILRWLGVDVDNRWVQEVVATQTFESFAGGRMPGQEDRTAEWRKGISGDWRNYFSNDDKALFKSLAGGLLVELGYEQNLDW